MSQQNTSQIQMIITSREKDLGGFTVRRILPYATHRMVGPFIFFDHMGPANLKPNVGVSVRPHPHINLATVTYLFSGKIQHKDSLGSDLAIEPGAVNLMTAGRGIVHSERTPEPELSSGDFLNGIQCWIALPEEAEEIAPTFVHHPKSELPEFRISDCELKLLLGTAYGRRSPAKVYSDLFYLAAKVPSGARLELPTEGREAAVYVVNGAVSIDGQRAEGQSMVVLKPGADVTIEAHEDSSLMLLGGKSVGPRFIFWNFVSSSKERLEQAKAEWKPGPRVESERFPPIPGDDKEFIPLPEETIPAPKGTAL
jgi:redox-sensitive bicupin YhaK (pirin superfamily)